jgi:hypothetical protein
MRGVVARGGIGDHARGVVTKDHATLVKRGLSSALIAWNRVPFDRKIRLR